jgi:hypothetical protein
VFADIADIINDAHQLLRIEGDLATNIGQLIIDVLLV